MKTQRKNEVVIKSKKEVKRAAVIPYIFGITAAFLKETYDYERTNHILKIETEVTNGVVV